jgi:hypothetical protein
MPRFRAQFSFHALLMLFPGLRGEALGNGRKTRYARKGRQRRVADAMAPQYIYNPAKRETPNTKRQTFLRLTDSF